jgi:hypothetical protein
MDSRPLLKDAARIWVLIDSKTFDDLLTKQNRLAMAILRHRDSKELTFVRSPFETRHEELKAVMEFKLLEKSGTPLVQIGQTESVFYGLKELRKIARKAYGRLQITEDELDRIRTVHVQDTLNRSNEPNIYITNDRVLLSQRSGVMSLEGASMFLDLFFKSKGKYFASSGYILNKGYWYLLSMRLKLPHYNPGDQWIDALAFRFCHCLMALDEIGIGFFRGSGRDTILYHFNYLIMLITGIFDNLALKANTCLEINLDPRKVSLSKTSGREFLKEVKSKNPVIRDHITRYVNFIQLIYTFREIVVHREALKKLVSFQYRDGAAKWEANFIPISDEQKNYIKACRDVSGLLDAFSEWGLSEGKGLYLDPYHFGMKAITTLKNFVDKYLELLGYPSFIETQKQKGDEPTRTLNFFERYHLGFEGD